MSKTIQQVFILSILTSLWACSATDVQRYADNHPTFAPEQFFNGPLTAHGVLKNRSGQVTRYFHASIDASWQQGTGTLVERFEFDDGEIQYRTWVLVADGEGRYRASAGDVQGTALARTRGNALHMDYTLQISYRGRPLNLRVEDWMWRIDDNTVLNHSTLRKWGFRVGSIQLVILRQAQEATGTALDTPSVPLS